MRNLLLIGMVVSVLNAGCGDDGGGLPGTCSLDFASEVNSNFGDAELDALLETTGRFSVAANGIDQDVRDACNAIATDLGGMMSADTETACMNAIAEIQAVKTANAMATLVVEYVPSVCSVSADAVVSCVGMCDASFDAMATPPTCEGGELSGTCSGMCMGSCTVEGSATCTGSCDAMCTGMCDAEVRGTCTGTCTGQCEGTCATMAGDGSCMGECTGTCRGQCMGTVTGSCSGTCSGSCSGSCRADVTGSCTGSCSGMCDVMVTEPRCEGGEWSVMADAECQAACEADASFDIVCTEPSLVVTFTGMAGDATELLALIATLEENLPGLLAALEKAEIVIGATTEFATRLGAAADAAASIGVEASSCVVSAIDAQVAATQKVQVSVDVSVMVSAEAMASGGA